MKRNYLYLVGTLGLLLAACSTNSSSPGSISSQELSSSEESSQVEVSSESSIESSEPSIDFSAFDYVEDLLWLPDLKIEVGQKEYIKCYELEFENSEILIGDSSLLGYEDSYLVGLAEGETFIVYHANDKYQKAKVSIAPKGTYTRAYNFQDLDLKNKLICNFGDSVTADATVGDEVSVWPRRLASSFKAQIQNYAVGGTTAVYPRFSPNVWKEYGGTVYGDKYDGCDLVYTKAQEGALSNAEIVFLNYGYNDMYYQPDLDAEGDDIYCVDNTFACCHSLKGSYRFMINVIRSVNPNCKIALMNVGYNEYDVDHDGYKSFNPYYKFDRGIKWLDLRKAIFEIGYEMDVKVMDPWNFIKPYFDFYNGRQVDPNNPNASLTWCFKDAVHPTAYGHKFYARFAIKN